MSIVVFAAPSLLYPKNSRVKYTTVPTTIAWIGNPRRQSSGRTLAIDNTIARAPGSFGTAPPSKSDACWVRTATTIRTATSATSNHGGRRAERRSTMTRMVVPHARRGPRVAGDPPPAGGAPAFPGPPPPWFCVRAVRSDADTLGHPLDGHGRDDRCGTRRRDV